MPTKKTLQSLMCGAVITIGTASAQAQDIQTQPTLNFYGVTGLIDMPTAESQPDGQFSATVSTFGGIWRGTLTFQAFPRLSGSFRYSRLEDWDFDGFNTFYDRSFDVNFRLVDEGRYLPSFLVGLQDFAGTGISAAEYVVATKHVLPRVKVTGGLGWGRLGSKGSFGSSPFGSRPGGFRGRGGQFEYDQWFRGPMSAFGGIEWQPTDKLGLKVEYSSDAYDIESGRDLRAGAGKIFNRKSSWNFGAEYQASENIRLGGYYVYGSEIGLTLQFSANPAKRPESAPQSGPGPLPVLVRPARAADPDAWSEEWTQQPDAASILRSNIAKALATQGMTLRGMTLTATRVQIRLGNSRYDAEAQAVGRAARILTRALPASVEVFEIVPEVDGMALSMVTLRRTDIEALEHAPGGDESLQARTRISEAGAIDAPDLPAPPEVRRLSWNLGPFVRQSFFDPDDPLRLETGVRLSGQYDLSPGLIVSGSVAQPFVGNLDSSRPSNSFLPRVRTDQAIYDDKGNPAIEELTAAYYTRPGNDLYGRVTAGYLERMYGGVSGEMLWKPLDGPLAVGAEINYVQQRDFNQLFGFRSYGVVTGHVSAYYNFGKGYIGQLDAGRYLAKDYGTTLTLSREFATGWKLSAFATFTDVSTAEFGEGSFDKGIRIEIPTSWITGRDSRNKFGTTLRPVLRDGGARLHVQGRLFDTVRDYDTNGLNSQWGRVWR